MKPRIAIVSGMAVITSYSIHYTKLYEILLVAIPETMAILGFIVATLILFRGG